ncbi:MAG: AtpZ/AtpI family protein [Bacteroidales bacterium]|jgi:F0F1-type ATP synthase assembly protein I|nr:AtpZ/AtpI family protein [Bacteroidales bacterium]
MRNRKRWDAGAAYSGMAFQMGAIIALGTYGGVKLDQWLNLSPLFTIVCALLSIALAMYVMVHKLSQKKKDE